MYDSLVIGAGIAGSVMARKLADAGKKVLLIEQRDHIGGNCYDKKDENGILIHQYGPHIFHTNEEEVFEYLSRYTRWHLFGHEVAAKIDGKHIPIPFNLNTLHQVYQEEKAKKLEKKLTEAYGEGSRVPILELMNQEDPEIREIADFVYQNIFLKYTMKQWGQKPEEVDASVTARVPVLISRDNRYFQDKYQGVPAEGYTPMFERILEHENITVQTGTDANTLLTLTEDTVLLEGRKFSGEVIYTGPIDRLFHFEFGRLPYRSLHFEFENLKQEDFQGYSVVNYTVSEEFTRITEFKHLTGQKADTTTIVREYPFAYTGAAGEIPYYAIINQENMEKYKKYQKKAEKLADFYLLGRLAEYQYYNIDAMVKKALELAEKIIR